MAELEAELRAKEAQLAAKDARIAEFEELVTKLTEQVAKLTERVEVLSEELGRNSRNSNKPPSKDPKAAKPIARNRAINAKANASGVGSQGTGGPPVPLSRRTKSTRSKTCFPSSVKVAGNRC